MARSKIDPAVSRKAYAIAEKALKERHKDEFRALIDMAYMELGEVSPRERAMRRDLEAAERKAAAAARREAKAQQKAIEAAELLRSLGIEVALPFSEAETVSA